MTDEKNQASPLSENQAMFSESQASMLPVEFPCEKEGVLKLLPHRDPFVWVSRVLSCEPGQSVVAELDVDPELPLFAGHFPGHPVLPGVILRRHLLRLQVFVCLSRMVKRDLWDI